MRTIFVLFDTLNRHMLEAYGGTAVKTPNFQRLAERSVVFDNHYVGSLPCMPARRDLHTGRLNFMHRSWGPLEPFDISLPSELAKAGVYSHLITDHYHYFEDGGASYHSRYHSFDFVRGQEGDGWKAMVDPPLDRWRTQYHEAQFGDRPGNIFFHNMANREAVRGDGDFPSVQCFDRAEDFLRDNHQADNWFLQIETFDPHEPFFAPQRLRRDLPTGYEGPTRDWPPYAPVREDDAEADELRANYKALLTLCDEQLGRLLDLMDSLDLWKDTMLVVSTDHGYLLGEHNWWAKNRMPAYGEVAHIPLFVHHPDHAHKNGTRRSALTQTPDIMPTVLEAFDCDIPASVHARSLFPLLRDPMAEGHDAVLYGYFGGAINLTDGRHTYFRYPEAMQDQELYQYTLMPCHMLEHFTKAELMGATLVRDCALAPGLPMMRIPVIPESPWYQSHGPATMQPSESLLFDLDTDPGQLSPITNPRLEGHLTEVMRRKMDLHGAPPEAFARLGMKKLEEA